MNDLYKRLGYIYLFDQHFIALYTGRAISVWIYSNPEGIL